jgi:hypothetical protein
VVIYGKRDDARRLPASAAARAARQYWRDRAKEAREHAAQMTDMVSKNTMLGIAQSYDFLAWRAQKEQRGSENSK